MAIKSCGRRMGYPYQTRLYYAVKQGLICIKFIEQLNYIHVILELNLIW